MAQQATEDGSTGIETSGEGTTATARKILDCCVGRHDETLREVGGTIVSVGEPVGTIFDVIVDVEFAENPRVVDSKSLGQYGIDELGFHGIDPLDDGGRITTFSAEYGGQLFGLRIIVTGDEVGA